MQNLKPIVYSPVLYNFSTPNDWNANDYVYVYIRNPIWDLVKNNVRDKIGNTVDANEKP